MVKRNRAEQSTDGGSDYFPRRASLTFIPSGSILLDCVLGGGWPLGRIANIVGDKSTGKTLLAIEACNNFARKFPKGKIWYRESEAAFDADYAQALGLPLKRVRFGPRGLDSAWSTVEDVFEDLSKVIDKYKGTGRPGLYIIDSLDALSTRAGLKRDLGEGYRLDKPKLLSELFERTVGPIKETNLSVLIISQVRDRIGFVVGEKHRRSGGRALDFYASQALWLTHIKTLKRTVHGQKRAWGIRILAQTKKNKITTSFQNCEFTVRFRYGIDDVPSALQYLAEANRLKLLDLTKKQLDKAEEEWWSMSAVKQAAFADRVHRAVIKSWAEVDEALKPPRPKYAPIDESGKSPRG